MPRHHKSKRKSEKNQENIKANSTEFEVAKIINHITLDRNVLYNVAWKPTTFSPTNQFLAWLH
eukprot:UN13517